MHKLAFKAAEASHCAKEQGKFWEMHSRMMTDQKMLNDLNAYAYFLDLDIAQFEDCLKTNKYADEVRKDMELADKLGINGAPSFVLALTDPKDPQKVTGISFMRGAQSFATFKKLIDQALADVQP